MYDPTAPVGSPDNPLRYQYPEDYLYQPTYSWRRPVEFDPFWLVFPTFGPFTAALNVTNTVNVPNDADFECRRITYHIDAATQLTVGVALLIPNITILLTDSGSGRNLMNAAAPLASIACGEAPMPPVDLAWPKIFTRNSTITASLTNFDGAATTFLIRLTLSGRKIFSRS